eukprot:5432361-Amphidinium_carterae.1
MFANASRSKISEWRLPKVVMSAMIMKPPTERRLKYSSEDKATQEVCKLCSLAAVLYGHSLQKRGLKAVAFAAPWAVESCGCGLMPCGVL